MVDEKDLIIKEYRRKNGTLNKHKWFMHYCDKCKSQRGYAPKNKSGLCISCSCLGRTISKEQRMNISKALKGNTNASNITPDAVIARTAKRLGLSIEQYLAEKTMSKTLRKIKKNMCDRLIRFLRNERRSVRYFDFSRTELVTHLESQFSNHPDTQEQMTWLNYGRISGINCWEIDHKIPLRYKENGIFYWNQDELSDPKSKTFKRAWSLNNLQPKWAYLNWSKGSKFKEN